MTRKTYNNVVKAGKMIQKKGYSEKNLLNWQSNFLTRLNLQERLTVQKCTLSR